VVRDHNWLACIDSSESVILFFRPESRDVRSRGIEFQLVQLDGRELSAALT